MPAVMIDNLICRHPLKSFIIPTFIIYNRLSKKNVNITGSDFIYEKN